MNLKEKYPKEYLAHWIGMLSATNCPLTPKGFKEQIGLYKEFEGAQEFIGLQEEVNTIVANNDLEAFEEIADFFELDKLEGQLLSSMCEMIIKDEE